MIGSTRRLALPALLLALLPAAPAWAQERADRVPGELIVRFKTTADVNDRVQAREQADTDLVRALLLSRAQLLEVEPGQTVGRAIAELEDRPDVAFAEPNYLLHSTATPNDDYFSGIWGLNNTGQDFLLTPAESKGLADADIDAPEAWDTTTGASSTLVAVVDTGVAYDHTDLVDTVWVNDDPVGGGDDDGNGKVDDLRGWDFVDGDNDPRDFNDHGTHVAGTIAAEGNNNEGTTGVSWAAKIMPVRVLGADGFGSTADIANAFVYAAQNGADVVNASLGGPGTSGGAMTAAVTSNPGTLFVVAAGNDTNDNDGATQDFPCNITAENLLCVAASNPNDGLAGFSNFGHRSVDLAAPGSSVLSTLPHVTTTEIEDFESGLATTWDAGGSGGSFVATKTPSLPYAPEDYPGDYGSTGEFVLDDEPTVEEYRSGEDFWIETKAKLGATGSPNCVLAYAIRYDLPDNDFFLIETSPDGNEPWTTVATYGDGDYEEDWEEGAVVLSSDDVYLRLRIDADVSADTDSKFDGIQMDDLELRCYGTTYDAQDYGYLSGTSMASPMVAGAAAVLAGQYPAATPATLRRWLLAGVDAKPAFGGCKTVTGGRLNLNGALTAAAQNAPDPVTTTAEPTDVGATSAVLRGTVDPNGTATSYRFDFGEAQPCGTSLTAQEAGSAPGVVSVNERLTDLAPATTYRYRLVAVRKDAAGNDRVVGTPGTTRTFTTAEETAGEQSAPPTTTTPPATTTPTEPPPEETPLVPSKPTTRVTASQPVGAVQVRVVCSTRCRVQGKLVAPRSLRKVLGGTRLLAEGRTTLPAGTRRVRLSLSKAALRRLRRAGFERVRASLTLTVTDAEGRRSRLAKRVRVSLKR